MATLEDRVRILEKDVADLKSERKELRSEIKREVSDTMSAAVSHITRVEKAVREEMAPIRELGPVFAEVKKELEGNRLERERRAGAEKALAQVKLEEETALAIEESKREARNRRRAIYIPLVVALIGGAVALVIAVVNSHGGH